MVDPFFQPIPGQEVPVAPTNTTQPSATNRPVAWAQKAVSKISTKAFLIGCATLFMVVVWWLTIMFYSLIKNPTQLTNLGIDPATTKTLLQSFAAIFFGLLTFLWIGILITNLYRLVTVKNKSKLWFKNGQRTKPTTKCWTRLVVRTVSGPFLIV